MTKAKPINTIDGIVEVERGELKRYFYRKFSACTDKEHCFEDCLDELIDSWNEASAEKYEQLNERERKGYLFRTFRNKVVDHLKKCGCPLLCNIEDIEGKCDLLIRKNSYKSQYEEVERRYTVDRLLQGLSQEEKTLADGRLGEKSYEEIAEILGIEPPTARQRWRRLLKKFRSQLNLD